MTYEICLLDPALAATLETASAVWNDSTYWETSLPAHDRAARKWRISDGLLAFNPRMQRMDPAEPAAGGGWLGKLKGKPAEELRYHAVSLPHGEAITNFTVFDQAAEVEFAYNVDAKDARAIAQEAWRHLKALTDMGFTTLLDTERNVLLDLTTDFEAVVAGYLANLEIDGEVDAADAAAERAMRTEENRSAAPAADAAPSVGEPFTGNVETKKKPWWKF